MKSQLDLSFSAKEKVNHKVGTNLRMFINRLHSDFPPHWHTDIEIIIPKEAPYRVVCGNQPLKQLFLQIINMTVPHLLKHPKD